MRRNYVSHIFSAIIIISMFIIAYSCSNSDTTVSPPAGPPDNTISGTITFADTTMLSNDTINGYYDLAAFATWPPTGPATANLKLKPQKTGNVYKANYTFSGMNNGSYVITSSWIRLPYTAGSVYGLGLYGCDTSHSAGCLFNPSVSKATIANNKGITGINFISWIDTTKKIYKF